MSEAKPLMGQIRRIRNTPLIDLIRFRFTGEFDWKSVVAESQLPRPLQDLLVELICKSKLTRSERTSVAKELVGHFQDGHQNGKDWKELEDDFGDPTIAAQLIQRSKERNRSMWSKLFKGLGVFSIAGLVIVALWGYSFVNRKANISVDYKVELNKRALASVENDRAWPIYRDTWTKYRFVEMNLNGDFSEVAEQGFQSIKPGHKAWPKVEKLLDDHQDLIDALRDGSRRPALGLELKNFMESYSEEDQAALFPTWYDSKPANQAAPKLERERLEESSVAAVMLPHVQAFRTASYLISADAHRAIVNKDIDRAIDDIRVQFGMARHAAECSCFVAALVGYSAAENGHQVIQVLLNQQDVQLSDAQLTKIQQSIASLDIKAFMDPQVDRVMVYDLLQRTYTDDGQGNGRITKQGLAMMSGLFSGLEDDHFGYSIAWKFLRSNRKELTGCFDEFYNEFAKDVFATWHEQPRTVEDLISTTFEPESPAAYFAGTFILGLDSARDAYHRQNSKLAASETAIALYRFRNSHGQFPKNLDALVPSLLKSITKDPLTDRPMSFVLKNGQPVLYFWGHDGIDDKGAELDGGPNQQVSGAFGNSAKEYKGDWILWAPVK